VWSYALASWGNEIRWNETKHVELEQFWHAFTSRGFDSVSWAFLLNKNMPVTNYRYTRVACMRNWYQNNYLDIENWTHHSSCTRSSLLNTLAADTAELQYNASRSKIHFTKSSNCTVQLHALCLPPEQIYVTFVQVSAKKLANHASDHSDGL